ncbi:ral guanine nucleotide dissociation stimulator-like isoform X8 [Ursus maritimus]|uniref:Ral guanine nucleotide dissociation stimulator-like isoform X8 n=1 Tax=Ursus maritimus TaxID=29073 RepID=A0A8M1GGJ4_URSMA|nr:ral guanine nucleotide dissociation stimulator-like isoform X8 [Ursus maritimus]
MWPSQCNRGAPPHLGHGELRKQEILFARIQLELFKKLLPHQCLGSIWSKRNKPGSEHLAPTVRATVAQFNGVAKCVITTCLGNPSMTARDRAMVVEHWIKVAKACQTLRNYSSLHAILSALQSVSIHCLEKTWEKVSRTQGVVPFLGTFLTKLLMLDTAVEVYLEGNEINHQKRNKEYQVMTDIMLLQVAAENYTLEPKDPFQAWFQAMEPLSKAERAAPRRSSKSWSGTSTTTP